MSDEEYYSETDDVSETNSENEKIIDKPLNKQVSISVSKYEDDSEPDDVEDESDEEVFDVNIPEDDGEILVESDDDGEPESDEESDEEEVDPIKKVSEKKTKKKKQLMIIDDDEEEDDEEYNDNYLEKFDSELVKNYIDEFHPECLSHNYDEISKLSNVVRNSDGIIIDPFHKTIPYLTKYEKARILGQRSKQIETGSKPFIKVPENIVDGYIIAELELKEKKMPFIIKRPIPGGGCEYWNLNDLEMIAF